MCLHCYDIYQRSIKCNEREGRSGNTGSFGIVISTISTTSEHLIMQRRNENAS